METSCSDSDNQEVFTKLFQIISTMLNMIYIESDDQKDNFEDLFQIISMLWGKINYASSDNMFQIISRMLELVFEVNTKCFKNNNFTDFFENVIKLFLQNLKLSDHDLVWCSDTDMYVINNLKSNKNVNIYEAIGFENKLCSSENDIQLGSVVYPKEKLKELGSYIYYQSHPEIILRKSQRGFNVTCMIGISKGLKVTAPYKYYSCGCSFCVPETCNGGAPVLYSETFKYNNGFVIVDKNSKFNEYFKRKA